MYQSDYIGYRNSIGFGETTLATGGTAAPFTAAIDLAIGLAPLAINFFKSFTASPAADARDFIKNAKPALVQLDPYNRIINVIAVSQKINPKAIDVNAREWILWYKQNYPNDYSTLSPDVKKYWNNFIDSVKSKYNNPNNMNANLDASKFSQTELNSNATKGQSLLNTVTSGGRTNWVLYGAIAVGVILFIKNIRK